MRARAALWTCVALFAAGCSKNETAQTQPSPLATVNFPMYAGATVVDVAPYDTTEIVKALKAHDTSSKHDDSLQPQRGSEELAKTSATLAELQTWIQGLQKTPPAGLEVSGSALRSAQVGAQSTTQWGMDGVGFASKDGARSVAVLVLDPKLAYAKAKTMLDLVDKYQSLPGFLKSPLEDQLKKQTGVSISQMLDRTSPVGLALYAVRTMHDSNDRAIIVLDGVKIGNAK